MGNKSSTRLRSFRLRTHTDIPGYVNQGIADGTFFTSRTVGYTRTANNVPARRQLISQMKNATGAMFVQVSNVEASGHNAELKLLLPVPGGDNNSKALYYIETNGSRNGIDVPIEVTNHLLAPTSEAYRNSFRVLQQNFTRRRRQISGIVVAGELGKALTMIMKPAKSLQTAIGGYFGRLAKAKKRPPPSGGFKKVLADTYLEETFGWQPLLADVRDGARTLARVVTRDALERQQFRAHGGTSVPVSSAVASVEAGQLVFGASLWFKRTEIQFYEQEVIHYGMYATRLRNPSLAASLTDDLITKSGFRFEDWAPSAWELAPWSFLVDYFTNVGDVLETCANIYTHLAWAARVDIENSVLRWDLVPDVEKTKAQFGGGPVFAADNYHSYSGNHARGQSSYRTVFRGAGGDLFSRELNFQLPFGRQWLNIAALALGARPPKPFY